MTIYCLALDNGKGWTDLRFRANEDTEKDIKGVKAGEWYTIGMKQEWSWELEDHVPYKVSADEAWLDSRPDRKEHHIIHLRGHVTLEKHQVND